MALPLSGPISIHDINVELGRAATAAFSLGGSEERALAGVLTGPIGFNDFYGKSSATEYTTQITLGYYWDGIGGSYRFYSYSPLTTGSVTVPILNGVDITTFFQQISGFSAGVGLSGKTVLKELVKVVVQTDGSGATTSDNITLSGVQSTFQPGMLSIPSYSGEKGTTPFILKLYFSKEYLKSFTFTADTTSTSIGILFQGDTFSKIGTPTAGSTLLFTYLGGQYLVDSCYYRSSDSTFRLIINRNGNPALTASSFATLRIRHPQSSSEIEYQTANATVSSTTTQTTFVWPAGGFTVVDNNSYDVVLVR